METTARPRVATTLVWGAPVRRASATVALAVALSVGGPVLADQPDADPAPPVGGGRAADLVAGDWNDYFPFRLGDSWTYAWRTEGPMATAGSKVRTRSFDGTSFLGQSVGYKLVSDDGAYHLYTFEEGTLAIHSSSEAGRLHYYDPPVVLAWPDMRVGESRTVTQADAGRRWTTTLVGVEDVEVPLGRFSRALAIRLEMDGPDFRSSAVHYFAPHAGLVAYRYELRDAGADKMLLSVRGDLELARLAGVAVSGVADLARVPAAAAAVVGEDRDLRQALKQALGRRYTWGAAFPGLAGEASLSLPGRAPVRGRFLVRPDLTVKVDADDDAGRAALVNEISSFVTLRKEVPFDLTYAETSFRKTGTRPDGGIVVTSAGDSLATTYVLRGGQVAEVSRSLGRVSYLARDRATQATEDGRTLSTEYDVVYRSNETQADIAVENTRDEYVKLGAFWVPAGRRVERTAPGEAPSVRELRLEKLKTP
jgi:hypothetical protein